MAEYLKPIPRVDETSRTYWEGTKRHEILVQKCQQCGVLRFYPRPLCTNCMSDNSEWIRCSGRGTIYTFTVTYQNATPGFSEEVPYVLAIIELEEEVRMMSNVIECKPDEVTIGMPVQAVFENITSEITLPKFRPLRP